MNDTPFSLLIQSLVTTDPVFVAWQIFKWMVVILSALYVVFALVVVRQVDLMGRTIKTTFTPVVKTIAFLHLGLAAIILAALVLLL